MHLKQDIETEIVDTSCVNKLRHVMILEDKTSKPSSNQTSHSSYEILKVHRLSLLVCLKLYKHIKSPHHCHSKVMPLEF